MSTSIQRYEEPLDGLTQWRPPESVLAEAKQAADALTRVISLKKNPVKFNGETYLEFEDWQTCAKFYGVTAKVEKTAYVEYGNVRGFEATAVAVDRNGAEISRAESLCLNDEENWGMVPKYEWQDELDENGKKIWVDGKDGKKRPKGKRVLIGETAKPLFQLKSMAQCVPLDSEILTRDGFKRYDELIVGEEVLAYDVVTDRSVWTPLREVNVFANQPTVKLRSRSLDLTCTDQHTWAVRKPRMVDCHILPFQELVKTCNLKNFAKGVSNAVVMAAEAESGDSGLSVRDAAVLGWLITDGCIRQADRRYPKMIRAQIDQSKEPYVAELRGLLGNDVTETQYAGNVRTFPTGRTYKTKPCTRFYIKAEFLKELFRKAGISGRRDCPSLVTRLSCESRKAMLDAMLKADGHNKNKGNRTGKMWCFGQKDPHVLETFQILAAMEGRALGLPDVSDDGFVRQILRSNRHVQLRAIRESYGDKQDVWCPTTDLGTWVMRQNGQVCITGNTRACSKVLRQVFAWIVVLAGYRPTPAEEMTGNEQFEEREDRKPHVTQPSRVSDKKPEPEPQKTTATTQNPTGAQEVSGLIESAKESTNKNGTLWLTTAAGLVMVPADKVDSDMKSGYFIKGKCSKRHSERVGDYWVLEALMELSGVQEGEVVAPEKPQAEKKLAPDAAKVADEIFGDKPQGQAAVAGMVENGTLKPASALPAKEPTKPGTIGLRRAQRIYVLCTQNKKNNNGFNEEEIKKILSVLPTPLEHLRDLETGLYEEFEKWATGEADYREFWKE